MGAESFTTEPQYGNWSMGIEELKAEADLAFSKGINSMELHIQPHQPWNDNIIPGMIGGNYGLQVNPANTFWQQSIQWNKYIARTQFLLRQGKFVGDICYLYPKGQRGFSVPEGYNGDAIDEVSFVKLMTVRDGEWVLPSGMRYKIVVLNNSQIMTFELAQKLKQLIALGGVVVGPKPLQTPSLENYPNADIAVKTIGDSVWNNCDGINVTETKYFKGKVYWNKSVTNVLQLLDVKKDVSVEENIPKESIVWTHRKTANTDIYFVSNQLNEYRNLQITFRIRGKVPQLWNSEDGSISDAVIWDEKDGLTTVTLPFKSLQSWFVIFTNSPQRTNRIIAVNNFNSTINLFQKQQHIYIQGYENGKYTIALKRNKPVEVNFSNLPKAMDLSNSWIVDFKKSQGAPGKIEFTSLVSWATHADKNIQYFSGTAIYTKTFALSKETIGQGKLIQLDLGDVKNFAEVIVNEKSAGLLWKAPYVLDISALVKNGDNTITIKITNLLANRMIGDEHEPEDMDWSEPDFTSKGLYRGRKLLKYPDWFIKGKARPSNGRYTFSTWNYYRKDDQLLPSGLLGPVQLVFGKEQIIEVPSK